MTDNLFDLLDQHGIPRLKGYGAGHTEKLICPKCGGGRTRDHCLSVTIAPDGMSAMWQCHRGNCTGFSGKVFIKDRHEPPKSRPRPASPFADAGQDVPDFEQPPWYWEFWSNRHIGKKTLDHFGVYASTHPGMGDCIVFPYRLDGKLVNRKYRAHPNKDFRNDAGSQPTLFNVDSIVPGKPLYWNEGETCVMTMHEVGFTSVVSMRDGAPQKVGQGDKRFEALTTHADLLDQVSEHILCPDADAPGEAWLQEVSRRLGRHKCKIVRWPEGRKDASDTLCMVDSNEESTIEYAVAHATRFPLRGVIDVTPEFIEQVWDKKPPRIMLFGVTAIDNVLKFPTEGKLVVIGGVPSHGKSTFMRNAIIHTVRNYARRWMVFAQEDDIDDYIRHCAKVFTEKSYSDITKQDRHDLGLSLMNGGLRILKFDGEREPPTIDTIVERTQFSILQGGTTDLLIDPFNEVEDAYEHGTQTQTQHIGRTLQRLKAFASQNSCNVWVIAHPSKPSGFEREPPDGYSLSGSANWANKPDLGFTVWMANGNGDVEIHIWKSRTNRWGRAKTIAKVWFNQNTETYHEPISKPEDKEPPHVDEGYRNRVFD